MRRGDSDRAIRRAGMMGRGKAKEERALAHVHGWLDAERTLPDEAALAEVFGTRQRPRTESLVAPYREQVKTWLDEGLQATTIHQALQRIHGFEGSFSSVRRFLRTLD